MTPHSSSFALSPESLTRLSAVSAMLSDSTMSGSQPFSLTILTAASTIAKSVRTMPCGFLALQTFGLMTTFMPSLIWRPPARSTALLTDASMSASAFTSATFANYFTPGAILSPISFITPSIAISSSIVILGSPPSWTSLSRCLYCSGKLGCLNWARSRYQSTPLLARLRLHAIRFDCVAVGIYGEVACDACPSPP